MKIAKEIALWSLNVYKIHIKEWPTVKDKILSLVPWDDINQRKNPSARENLNDSPHEMTWTDYFLQGSDNSDGYERSSWNKSSNSCKYISTSAQYEPVFLSMISPYLKIFEDC